MVDPHDPESLVAAIEQVTGPLAHLDAEEAAEVARKLRRIARALNSPSHHGAADIIELGATKA